MITRIFRFLVWAAVEATGAKCPKCGSTNTDKQNGICCCYDCDHEW